MDGYRYLTVHADGTEVNAGHNKLKGCATMSLRPDTWIMDIYDLSAVGYAQLKQCKKISVIGESLSEVCSGAVEEVYQHTEDGRDITTVLITDGIEFWKSSVSFSLAEKNSVEKTLRYVVSRSTSPIKISSIQIKDRILNRGQVFHGQTARYISDLSKSAVARAFVTHDSLTVLGRGMSATIIRLRTEGGLINIARSQNVTIAKLGVVVGYRVGQLVVLPDDATQYRLLSQRVDADNSEGSWITELLLVDERNLSDDDWSGGV